MMADLRVLDLFSGIGGFALGLERAGFQTVAFCEIEPYARRILRKHWPAVPLFEDVRTLTAKRLRKEGIEPNVICDGFPCQDISTAGKGKGIEGERSGLWKEMLRLIKEVRPAWVIAENVPALRSRGADTVLDDLERAGYAARPLVVGAHAVGAPHKRDRVWIVANTLRPGHERISGGLGRPPEGKGRAGHPSSAQARSRSENVADASGFRPQWRSGVAGADPGQARCGRIDVIGSNGDGNREDVADADGLGCLLGPDAQRSRASYAEARGGRENVSHTSGAGCQARRTDRRGEGPSPTGPLAQHGWWASERGICRVVDGVPDRVDRLRCLGNSVVPQVVELIGRAVMAHHEARS